MGKQFISTMGLFKRTKNTNKPLIRQILDLVPGHVWASCIKKYKTDKGCSRYMTYDQFVAMTFGQLNKCLTLTDISTGIGVSETFIGDLGLRQSPARSTMSDGNAQRNWQVYEMLYYRLLNHYGNVLKVKRQERIIEEIKGKTIKLIDSTTISLCLKLFDWAKFRTAKGGIKIHTCWDDALMIPDLIYITEAKVHDSKGFEQKLFPAGTIIVEDRGYFDFKLMKMRIDAHNVFVTRIKENTLYEVVKELELPEDKDHHILLDEVIRFTGVKAKESGLIKHELRRVVVYDAENNDTIEVITDNLSWTAATIASLYKKRWDIEIFFKQLKQNLQVKTFIGTSENAVKSQIYIALICFLLIELIRRNKCESTPAFSNFCERIRICLTYYLTLDYVCNHIKEGARRTRAGKTAKLNLEPNLFSG